MNKINIYIFNQIIKSCTLIFFVFVSIAWLMQLSRLFSFMNNLQIPLLNILGLSIWLIPNLLNITLPFIIIFGLVLSFIKFDKDKEIIAIYSLGLSLKEIRKPFYLLILLALVFYFILNFIFSPYSYEIYKQKEFKLRNTIEFDKINISNFIKLDQNLTIDFENKDNIFEDVLINFKDENNNLIYAKKGKIDNENDSLTFTLFEGFKLVVNENEIEKLKFDNYKIEFPNIVKKEYQNFDKNTIGLNILIKELNDENIKIIVQRIFDLLIIISFILYFYLFIIKTNHFRLKNFFLFIIFSIIILTIDNFLENLRLDNFTINLFYCLNVISIHIIGYTLKKMHYYE